MMNMKPITVTMCSVHEFSIECVRFEVVSDLLKRRFPNVSEDDCFVEKVRVMVVGGQW